MSLGFFMTWPSLLLCDMMSWWQKSACIAYDSIFFREKNDFNLFQTFNKYVAGHLIRTSLAFSLMTFWSLLLWDMVPEWQISACIAYDSMFLRDLLMAIRFKLLTYMLQDVSWRCPCDFFTAWWYAMWQPSLQNLPKIAIMRYLWWIRPIYDPFIHLKHFEKNCRTSYRDVPGRPLCMSWE